MITSFRGQYACFSNFFVRRIVTWQGFPCASVEHAFQAEKMTNPSDWHRVITAATPAEAKRLARSLPCRPDWESVKTDIMRYYVERKFQETDLRAILLSTGEQLILEGNTWGDRVWGAVLVNGSWDGENRLGRILMEVRQRARESH